MLFTMKHRCATRTSSRRCWIKMATRCISAAHRFLIHAMHLWFCPRPKDETIVLPPAGEKLEGGTLKIMCCQKIYPCCATSASTLTAPVSCAPMDSLLRQRLNNLKHWNSYVHCIMGTKLVWSSLSMLRQVELIPNMICTRHDKYLKHK